jgi:hypothetical protein
VRRPLALWCGAAAVAVALAGCGGGASSAPSSASGSSATASSGSGRSATAATNTTTHAVTRQAPAPPPPPAYPQLLAPALSMQPTPFVPAVLWKGSPVAWISRSPSGVAMMSFKQPTLQLRLHSGAVDAGTLGWRYGPVIAGLERKRLVAAFNGGFKLDVGAGGFESFGRVGAPLSSGLGSVVTYTDGTTDIGSWHNEVPAPGQTVASVRQNLPLLIDHGTAASTIDCTSCWGATLGGVIDPARSALGIQANGHLVWAGAEHATVSTIADALLSAGVVRAVELDINPEWVAGYLYGHRGGAGPLAPVPVVPGQQGIPGQYLAPWSRDFFTVVAS